MIKKDYTYIKNKLLTTYTFPLVLLLNKEKISKIIYEKLIKIKNKLKLKKISKIKIVIPKEKIKISHKKIGLNFILIKNEIYNYNTD